MLNQTYPFALPDLPYANDALAPVLTAETLSFHYGKHFQTYITNLNKALEPHTDLHALTLGQLLDGSHPLPESARTAILNNGGGAYNHDVYFKGLAPAPRGPEGKLLALINEAYGSLDAFKEAFAAACLAVFGSGWAVLVLNAEGKLQIVPLKNQETVLPMGVKPLLTVDVWEHAYYLQYQNLRARYVQSLWDILGFPVIT